MYVKDNPRSAAPFPPSVPEPSAQPEAAPLPHPAEGPDGRPVLLVCGDLHNLGDLALAAQNIALARKDGRKVTVRTWGLPSPAILRQLESWGCDHVDGRDLAALLAVARGADLVLGGGELVRANTSLRALGFLERAAAAVRRDGGAIVARGLGVGAVTGLRARLWRRILGPARLLAARDMRSLRNLRRIVPGAAPILSADMAFLGAGLAPLAGGGDPARAGAIVVAPCIDASETRAIDTAALHAVLAAARDQFPLAPVVFAVHDPRPGMDRDAAETLAAMAAPGAVLTDAGGDLARLLALYRDAALVVTNRLHAGIFATLFDRPLLVLDDGNPKLGILSDRLAAPSIQARGAPGADAATAAVRRAIGFDPRARAAARAAMAADARRNLGVRRTAIFNVKYSPNLGDGIIAECLEGELRRARPELEPVSVDLAGRNAFSAENGRHRRSVLALIERMPERLRHRILPEALRAMVRLRLRPRFARALAGCEAAIVGGGALFADVDRNFPLKVGCAVDLCAARGIPVAVASVGVSSGWSRTGLRRVTDALAQARLLSVTVRDEDSVGRWHSLFGQSGLPEAALAPDPGLLAAQEYGLPLGPALARDDRPTVGLCITGPMALRLHDEQEHDDRQLDAWLRAVAKGLVREGCTVVLFTNGSPEDRSFRDRVARYLARMDHVVVAPDFANPGELAHAIARFDCVLAHRLHACIVAYSYRIPSVGFAWDRKLDSFFAQCGRSRFMTDPRETSPESLVALALEALRAPIDAARHARLVDDARAGVHALAERVAERVVPA